MRSNIVNRLSVWHYCKNNCLHVFQWFRLTLIARGNRFDWLLLALSRPPLLLTPMPLIWVVPAGTNAMTSCYRNRTVQVRPNGRAPRTCETNDARSDDTGVGGSLSHGVIRERRLRRACYDGALRRYAWWQIVRARMCSWGCKPKPSEFSQPFGVDPTVVSPGAI